MITKKALIILSLSFSSVLQAQVYTIDQYTELLGQENLTIRMAGNETLQAAEDFKAARSEYLPRIYADAGYRRDFNRSYMFFNSSEEMTGFPEKFQANYKNALNASVMLEQSVLNISALQGMRTARTAESLMRMSEAERKNETLRLGKILFYQTLYAKKTLEILEENSSLAEQQYRQMKEMFAGGLVSEFALKQSELYYQQTLPDKENAMKTVEELLREMRSMANIKGAFDIEGELVPPEDPAPASYPDNIPDGVLKMELGRKNIEIAERKLSMSKAAYVPKISLRFGYSFDAYDDSFRFRNTNGVGYGMINISIPIFSGGYNCSNVRKSRLAYDKSLMEFENLGNMLNNEFNRLKREKEIAIEKMEIQRELVRLATDEVDASEEKLRLGLMSSLEMRETRIGYIQAKLQLLSATLDYMVACVNMDNLLK